MVRRVVAEELRPVKEALAPSGTMAAPSGSADGSPVSLMRDGGSTAECGKAAGVGTV